MSDSFAPEFREWPKTPRLFRDIVVTEKIDGTNAAIHIERGTAIEYAAVFDAYPLKPWEIWDGEHVWRIAAQSRKRLITPESDNYGFARWVRENAAELVKILGPGLHFGEWWGQGIQRRYGLDHKRFSLFNTARWYETAEDGLDSMATRAELSSLAGQIGAVPVLYEGPFREAEITSWLGSLREFGSMAAPGFMNPEGICVYHTQTRGVFKVTLDNNDAGKWEAA
ncbi:RNA ligase family protein [Streptomyces sp. NPDC091376]|uniref:RNA ligase family protein n=1 Tax=Streptomyces sp. NPDC091376 TaxID=3365994 RepID=UPI00382565EC